MRNRTLLKQRILHKIERRKAALRVTDSLTNYIQSLKSYIQWLDRRESNLFDDDVTPVTNNTVITDNVWLMPPENWLVARPEWNNAELVGSFELDDKTYGSLDDDVIE